MALHDVEPTDTAASAPSWSTFFREFTSCLASQNLTARAFRRAVAAATSQVVQENVKIGPDSRYLPCSPRLARGLV